MNAGNSPNLTIACHKNSVRKIETGTIQIGLSLSFRRPFCPCFKTIIPSTAHYPKNKTPFQRFGAWQLGAIHPVSKNRNRVRNWTFFHPDYTVGPGVSPDRAAVVGRSRALPPIGNGRGAFAPAFTLPRRLHRGHPGGRFVHIITCFGGLRGGG